jgi:hypothetical protein
MIAIVADSIDTTIRRAVYGGAITLQGVTNKNIIRIEQPQQDKQRCL